MNRRARRAPGRRLITERYDACRVGSVSCRRGRSRAPEPLQAVWYHAVVGAPAVAARTAIVIVNYRSYDELRECLRSLATAADPDTVIVVVDHATDPSSADTI